MGFYGNITNTSKTQFQFDKIYSSRYDMETSARTDGIYAGRYVLVEYDTELSQDNFQRVFINGTDGQMYNAPDVTAFSNQISIGASYIFDDDNKHRVNTVPIGAMLFTAVGDDVTRKYTNVVYYKVTGTSGLLKAGQYKQITADKTTSPDGLESTVSNYTKNYAIDNEKYGAGRGYDSTVWQKAYIDNVEKYIMIAELNSVVPTFGVSADAPTIKPIAPHFDTQSTDLYYKLHWQPAWGMRIAEGKPGTNEKQVTESTDVNVGNYPTDEEVNYDNIIYKPESNTTEPEKISYNGAIYYNRDGFKDNIHTYYDGEFKKDKISIKPAGVSGMKYHEHGDSIGVSKQPDIQEISIMLPSLGNALCDIWDKVYGYDSANENKRYRDIEWKDALLINDDEDKSQKKFDGKATPLEDVGKKGDASKGYMTRSPETIAGCINMAHDLMGMILTTSNIPLTDKGYSSNKIYYDKTNGKYYRVHRFPLYDIVDVKAVTDLDESKYSSDQEYTQEFEKQVNSIIKSYKDEDWYLVIDSSKPNYQVRRFNKKALTQKALSNYNLAHIRRDSDGKIIYGYEKREIVGFADDLSTINGLILQLKYLIESDDSETRDRKTVQGTINVLNDIINIFEDLTPGEFLICDDQGHVNSAYWTTKQDFGYSNYGLKNKDGKEPVTEEITGVEDQWILLNVDEKIKDDGTIGVITLNHQFNEQSDTKSNSDKNNTSFDSDKTQTKSNISKDGINNDGNINTLQLYTPIVDSTGHVVGRNTETVTLPYGYKYLKTNGISNQKESDLHTTFDENTGIENKPNNITEKVAANANSTQDQITINTGNKWIQTRIEEAVNNDTITIAHEIHKIDKEEQKTNNNGGTETSSDDKDNIVAYDVEVDAAGHVTKNQKHIYTLPYSFKTIKVTNSDAVTSPDSTIAQDGQIANNTQDTLTFSASNKWIKLDNNTEDTIKVGHKLSNLSDSAKANTYYGLKQNESITTLDGDNKFEVPCFKFDEAGHIIGARTHTVELPENFDRIAVTTNTAENESEIGTPTTNGTIIKANSLIDTLTFAEGNKWINITPDVENDKLIFSHYSKQFNESTNKDQDDKKPTNFNSSNSKIFSVQEIIWDQAGHLTGSNKHEYQLPDGIKNVIISNDGSSEDSFNNISSSTGILTADSLVDTFKIDTKNRWIQPVVDANSKTISFYHAKAGGASNNLKESTNTAQTPGFGQPFNIPVIHWDAAGHITEATTQTITIPSFSGTVTASDGSVLTGFIVDNNGKASYTSNDVSKLKLTGYEERPTQGAETRIYTGDTINTAFKTLESLIKDYASTISNLTTRIESCEGTITTLEGTIADLKEKIEKLENPTV